MTEDDDSYKSDGGHPAWGNIETPKNSGIPMTEPHPRRCETCKNNPCKAIQEASKTISSDVISGMIKALLTDFTALVGCASHSSVKTEGYVISDKLLQELIDYSGLGPNTLADIEQQIRSRPVQDTGKVLEELEVWLKHEWANVQNLDKMWRDDQREVITRVREKLAELRQKECCDQQSREAPQ